MSTTNGKLLRGENSSLFHLYLIVTVGILMFLVGFVGAYMVFVFPRAASLSQQGNKEKIFPTKNLQYLVPANWTVTSYTFPFQNERWWDPEYSVRISSTNSYPSKISCGINCNGKTSGGNISITSFGTNSYSSPKEWYEARLNHRFPDVRYEDGPSIRYKETTFLSHLSFCTYYASTNNFDTNNYVPPTDIEGIPKEIFSNGCFVKWGNNVYEITASVLSGTPTTNDDFNTAVIILKQFQFK